MINVDKRFEKIYSEINKDVITDNPTSKQLLKLFYLEGLTGGVELSKDIINASQMQEIVKAILAEKK